MSSGLGNLDYTDFNPDQNDTSKEDLKYLQDSSLGTFLPDGANISLEMFLNGANKNKYVFLAFDWCGQWQKVMNINVLCAIQQHQSLKNSYSIGTRGSIRSNGNNSRHMTLDHCLHHYIQEESNNDWMCPNCKEHKDNAKKVIKFMSSHLPKVLIISLVRHKHSNLGDLYGFKGASHSEKMDQFIDFPLEGLNLSPYCVDLDGSAADGNADALYDLFGVCNHYGRMGFGHYTAYNRDWLLDGQLGTQWYKVDDEDVSEVKDPEDIKTSAAYILFYRRRE